MPKHPFSFFRNLQKITSYPEESLSRPWDISSGASLLIRWGVESGFPTVECLPASVTIIEEPTLAKALVKDLNKSFTERSILFRFKEREVRPSEIHVAGLTHSQWRETTFFGAAKAAGVPQRVIPELVSEIGLSEKLHKSLAQSNLAELRRFAVCCSFFTKTHFVLLDNPFGDVEDEWESKVANLVLEAALITKKIFLITNPTRVPHPWRGNPVVKWQSEDQIVKDSASNRLRTIRGMLNNVNRNSADLKKLSDRYIYTKPQTILKPPVRASIPGAIGREKIANPNIVPENED